MDFSCVPIIVTCCYIFGELFKLIFKQKQDAYRFIPLIMAIMGGVIGVIMFFSNPELIGNANNIWDAMMIGIVSGSGATGTNQIIKQLFNL